MNNENIMTWEEENDLVIESILKKFFTRTDGSDFLNVELQITADCNQKCEYCYLYKYKDNLYPKEFRSPELILNNLNIILNYFLEKKYKIKEFDLFSGEIWETNFGIKVLKAMLYYVAKADRKPDRICIPSNGYFILNKKYLDQILTLRKEFLYYGTELTFSISVDGPLLDKDNRSLIDSNKEKFRDKDFYKQLFDFCKQYNYGFHPMVNANNIEKWPEQYDWWMEKLKDYDLNYFDYIMFLEVRNDEWTFEKIKNYLFFLNHCFNQTLQLVFDNDKEKFLKHILGINLKQPINNYFHLGLMASSPAMGCSVDRSLQFRVGDLAWTLCHRTSYEKFLYGRFKVKDNKIIGMEALNLPLLFAVYGLGYKGHPKCDVCNFNEYCLKGCYGAQFEANKELFFPCSTVCDLYKTKILFLYMKCKDIANDLNNIEINNKLDYIKGIFKEEKELKEKWIPIINTLK